jgi:DNA-binding beta-propeller fold protein YncE/mono/diheme cytochrome c family protein
MKDSGRKNVLLKVRRLVCATALLAACSTARGRPSTSAMAAGEATHTPKPPPSTADGRRATQGASIVMSPDRRLVIAFDEDNGMAVAIDAHSGKALSSHRVGRKPVAGVALASGRVAVVDRAAGVVALYALGPSGLAGEPLASRRVADDPVAIAASPDQAVLYVTSGATSTLTALTADTLAPTFAVSLPREPRAIAPSLDGTKLYVGQLVGGIVSVVSLADRGVRSIRLPLAPERQRGERSGEDSSESPAIRFRNIAALARTLTLDPRGDELYVAYIVEANGSELPVDARGNGYGGLDQAVIDALRPVTTVSVLDTVRERWIAPTPAPRTPPEAPTPAAQALPESPAPAARDVTPVFTDPTAIALRESDGRLVLVSRGTDSLGVLDRGGSDPSLHGTALALDGCDGASGVAIDADGSAWINCQFDHRVVAVKRDGTRGSVVPLGDDPLARDVALGRRKFFQTEDDAISRLGFSCATCHPDGRDDGNVWSSENGMRQTISLAGRLVGTAPYNWNGHNPTIDLSLQQTIIRLSGLGVDRKTREALAAYLLRGLDPPHVVTARDALVARGESVFGRAGCATCHNPERQFSDGQAHDVHSAVGGDSDPRFDTPSLVGVGATAPYFHDGRYASLKSLLLDNHDRMGHTSDLSREDLRSLIAYLNAL